MKKSLTVFTTLTILFYTCSSDQSKNKTNAETVDAKPVDYAQIYLDSAVNFWTAQSKSYPLTELLNNFDLQEDKVEGGGWYLHKKRKNKHKNHIEVPVSTNGYLYLKTNYCGDDWIFHDHLVLNIAGGTLYSSKIESYSDYTVKNNSGGQVFESLHLTDPLKDGIIIQAIFANFMNAKNADSLDISIRLKGDQKYKDIKLGKEEIGIIAECYLLSQMLTVTNNEYISNIIFDQNQPKAFYLTPK